MLDVINLVYSQPWPAICLGSPDWDYDPDWRQAEAASISLIRSLADNDLGFGDRADEVWQVLELAVRDRTEQSALDDGDDLLTAAINRPCTKAFETVLSFVLWEHRTTGSIRASATDLLNGVLCLEGTDGSQFRSVLASRFRILIDHVPAWVATSVDRIFGPNAPPRLGQLTMDEALRWSRPSRMLMENYQSMVIDAAKREVENSLECILLAYLWQISGYSLAETSATLVTTPGLASRCGQALAHVVVRSDALVVSAAVALWRGLVRSPGTTDLGGFGWFSVVPHVDDDDWSELTLATINRSKSSVSRPEAVATRASTLPPSPTVFSILDALVRHSEPVWERHQAAVIAASYINAAGALTPTSEYLRLRTALEERGLLS